MILAPSSSGLGRRAFIPKIAGSIPAGVTDLIVYNSRCLIYTRRMLNEHDKSGIVNLPEILQQPQLQDAVVSAIKDSAGGEAFLSPMEGKTISGIQVARFEEYDVVAFTSDEGEAVMVVTEKGSLISIEKRGEKRLNLAFQDDISSRRLDIISSDLEHNVIYRDPTTISGNTVQVDPIAEFAKLACSDPATIKRVRPSWYTEDRVTIRLSDDSDLIVRTERHGIHGAITITENEKRYMNIGDRDVTRSELFATNSQAIPARVEQ